MKVEKTSAELEELRRQLEAVRNSFSYRLGNMLVQAVYRPGRNTLLLPYRLLRLCVTEFRRRRTVAVEYPVATKLSGDVPAARHGASGVGRVKPGSPQGRGISSREAAVAQESMRYCPICENSSVQFLKYGVMGRDDAKCPHCGAVERHRLFWLYVSTRTNLFDGKPKRMLHVAPEPGIELKLKQLLGQGYLTADLSNPKAMVKMDITDIQYPAETFDIIYCSHVLEHVKDDRKAIRELCRVLKSTGWAILDVPIAVYDAQIPADRTIEDPTITDPEQRLKAFGQQDHVRRYGPDYADRLREAGFIVSVIAVEDLLDPNEAVRMGLSLWKDPLHYCTKQ